METILGIKGKDFVMLAADCSQAHSIIMLKEGKITKIVDNLQYVANFNLTKYK